MYTLSKDDYTVKVTPCEDPINPRQEYDHMDVMVCWHKRYTLGDEQPKVNPDQYVIPDGALVVPLYMLDHSGLSVSSKPFSCPWDSGQIGFSYCTLEMANRHMGTSSSSFDDDYEGKPFRESCLEYIESGIKEYDSYITGDVYDITLKDEYGDVIDSLHSVFGYECAKEEASSMIEEAIKSHKEPI